MHSTAYGRIDDIPDGAVLVVGGGNTGFQIAEELAPVRDVHLSVGSRPAPLPQRLLGRDIFWWLSALGVFNKTIETRIGQRLKERLPLIGSSPARSRKSASRCICERPARPGERSRSATEARSTWTP